jgi:L,D-peptidoglycan transpeptidase YkuD (ErfK/YbiS/YcfS/YnhG family)
MLTMIGSHRKGLTERDRHPDFRVKSGDNVPGAGSAIFLHIARPDFSPTAGCIAVERDVMIGLVPLLGPGSTIAIRQ